MATLSIMTILFTTTINTVFCIKYFDYVQTPIDGQFILNSGDKIESTSYSTYLVMQGDGNLVLHASSGNALWSIKSTDGADYAELQSNGNLVVKHNSDLIQWQSNTSGNTATQPHRLVVTLNCAYISNNEMTVLWDTATSGCAGSSGVELIEHLDDDSFNSSSEYDSSCYAKACPFDDTGWCPANPVGEWLQVDLKYDYVIESISTKGSKVYDEWVETYTIDCKRDGQLWSTYPSELIANIDEKKKKNNVLSGYIIARYLKFYPTSWHDWPMMKVEAYGHRM